MFNSAFESRRVSASTGPVQEEIVGQMYFFVSMIMPHQAAKVKPAMPGI